LSVFGFERFSIREVKHTRQKRVEKMYLYLSKAFLFTKKSTKIKYQFPFDFVLFYRLLCVSERGELKNTPKNHPKKLEKFGANFDILAKIQYRFHRDFLRRLRFLGGKKIRRRSATRPKNLIKAARAQPRSIKACNYRRI
jgi:hypothetical protein